MEELWKQGAEARLYLSEFHGRPCVIKERFSKTYRHPTLDRSLTSQRTKSEVRAMMKCRSLGLHTPAVLFVDLDAGKIYMEHLTHAITVKDFITQNNNPRQLKMLAKKIGQTVAVMHQNNLIHGDLTTSNLLLNVCEQPDDTILYLIDFGLGYQESLAEDKAVDLYVLERALISTHPDIHIFPDILTAYSAAYQNKHSHQPVITKLEEVRLRGRKRTMVG